MWGTIEGAYDFGFQSFYFSFCPNAITVSVYVCQMSCDEISFGYLEYLPLEELPPVVLVSLSFLKTLVFWENVFVFNWVTLCCVSAKYTKNTTGDGIVFVVDIIMF